MSVSSECPPELYGEDCSKHCHCVNTSAGRCEQVDGRCLHGCLPGWTGEDCQQAVEVKNRGDDKQPDKGSNGGDVQQQVEGMKGDNRQKSAKGMNGNHKRPKGEYILGAYCQKPTA